MEYDMETMKEYLQLALENANLFIWEYDIVGKRSIFQQKAMREYKIDKIVNNSPESIIEKGLISLESIEEYRRIHREISNGNPCAKAEICFVSPNKVKTWMMCHYTTIFKDDKPVSAIGCAIDISKTKELEQKFNEEMKNIESALSENLIVKVRSNITQNVVESYISKSNYGVCVDGMEYETGAEKLAQSAYTLEEQNKIRYYLNRQRVISSFEHGETTYSIDYRRKSHDGEIIWVNTTVRTYQNPVTKDIMSFMYSADINEERIKEDMLKAIMALEYDYVAYIDLQLNQMKLYYGNNDNNILTAVQVDDYIKKINFEVNKYMVGGQKKQAIEAFMPDIMTEELKNNKVVSNVFSMYGRNKDIREKRFQYAYLNKYSTQIIMTCTDVTDIIAKQKQQQAALESALIAAKQANSAKSNFLSRMSHEIRTPMNAIIGMSTIAAQSIGNDSQVEECISKIGISSRFLLSLINDILDMSRIESGKMLLKNEKLNMEDLFHDINAICYPQAQAKSIDYECIVDNNIERIYMGDYMKLQQVIINIVSNAIKFTPIKGKVTLRARQIGKDGNKATIRCIVNDTGCGISEEFIPHLFEAFSQEHGGTTSLYGGTGLGLAICKNIVDMMGGHISVRSIVGSGTEFSVDINLGITEESKLNYTKKIKYNFEQLSVLVVDDDISICQQTVVTLKEIGVTSEWVDSGIKAIEKVTEKWNDKKYYDIILLDWKMPGMDGIETAREIRKIVGPDVTIIIMTAYDWASIEYEAKLAGVNMMMTKPMFKSTLISAFEKTFTKGAREKFFDINDYDFGGKRILLAEDHPLNVEVAKKLLENKGLEVEHSENGLRALEMFTISKPGYYDAILMDIRMPYMDGLQAARAIRKLTKEDAKTIPIIAMTANAFEEDIEKSKDAGMDAHLAKPIEPRLLYETLYSFLGEK